MPAKFYLSSCKLFSLLYLTSALSIPVGIGEFLEGWLGLVNRLANTKYLFESTHTLPTTSFVPGHEPFNAAEFMVYVHKVCILVQFYIPGGDSIELFVPNQLKSIEAHHRMIGINRAAIEFTFFS